jgi:hypothetical protein
MSRIKRVEVHEFAFELPDLGWYSLNIERRELGPGDSSLPGGTRKHLIIVSLAGVVTCSLIPCN